MPTHYDTNLNAERALPPDLEPGAGTDTALSQAISLKRIADSLDRLASADKQATDDAYARNVEAMRAAVPGGTDWSAPPTGKEYTDDNPWIEWRGGECPVPDMVMVDMRLANGAEFIGRQAGLLSWRHLKNSLSESNIVAWRLHK